MPDSKIKRFPLRLEDDFSSEIDACVFYSDYTSKHQYIIDAVKAKVKSDKIKYKIDEKQSIPNGEGL